MAKEAARRSSAQRFLTFLSLASSFAFAIAPLAIRKKRSRQPTLTRRLLVRPARREVGSSMTAWQQLLSCGKAGDFIASINFPLPPILERILPAFEEERAKATWGGPYRKCNSLRGRKPQLRSIDLIGLALWHLKSPTPMCRLCYTLGLVSASVSKWLDLSLETLFRAARAWRRKEK